MEEAPTERSSRFRPPISCKGEVSLLERSKPTVLCTKISGLLMFSEIGKLRTRKNFLYLSRGVCLDILNMCVWISIMFFTGPEARGILVTQMRPHNWLITSCIINAFKKLSQNPHDTLR